MNAPKRGRPPKLNNKVTWTGRLAPDVVEWIKLRTAMTGSTQVSVIEDAIRATEAYQKWRKRRTEKTLANASSRTVNCP